MIIGAHSIIYSKDAEADRIFLRDMLHLTNVDVGGGWLIFGLPPAEVAVHPHDANDEHEFYFMCDDVEAFVAEMQGRGVACDPAQDMGWGVLTQVALPGGGKVGVYQPRHLRPRPMSAHGTAPKPADAGGAAVGAGAKPAGGGRTAVVAGRNAAGGARKAAGRTRETAARAGKVTARTRMPVSRARKAVGGTSKARGRTKSAAGRARKSAGGPARSSGRTVKPSRGTRRRSRRR